MLIEDCYNEFRMIYPELHSESYYIGIAPADNRYWPHVHIRYGMGPVKDGEGIPLESISRQIMTKVFVDILMEVPSFHDA